MPSLSVWKVTAPRPLNRIVECIFGGGSEMVDCLTEHHWYRRWNRTDVVDYKLNHVVVVSFRYLERSFAASGPVQGHLGYMEDQIVDTCKP